MSVRGLVDYHTHTSVTIDGRMSVAQACERAMELGLREIAFTNHVMLTQPDYNISPEALVSHWEQIQVCQKRYPTLTIRLGLEVDYYPEREVEIAATLQRYENLIARRFDFVMGAVHTLHDIFFSSQRCAPQLFERFDLAPLYGDYFALATRAVQSRLFDVMAHADLIKKYVGELTPRVPFAQYRDAAASFVNALIECGVGIEINTKGLKLPVGEIYPSEGLLALYIAQARARGVAPIITLGSDAHKADDVGARLAEGVAALRRAGHSALTLFDQRKAFALSLNGTASAAME